MDESIKTGKRAHKVEAMPTASSLGPSTGSSDAILLGKDQGQDITSVGSLLHMQTTFIISAAAAKSLPSCPTLCDPVDGSPPGSPLSLGFSRRRDRLALQGGTGDFP